MRYLIAVVFVFSIGCGKTEPKPDVANPAAEFKEFAKKASENAEKQKAEAEEFLAGLKTNPQPLFDLALKSVKSSLAETAGDDAANEATITVDESTLKTFGPEKWTVRGQLKSKDANGNQRETTWQVTMQMIFDKLQARSVQLEVRD